MEKDNTIQQINLEEVLRQKNPRLLKFLPSFIIRYVKKIIHQKELNLLLTETKDDFDFEFIKKSLSHFQITVESVGSENIPINGGCIFVCNHPLGGIDGIAVLDQIGKIRLDVKAIVNDLLMNLKNLNNLLIPVNKHGKNLSANLKRIDEVYALDECILVFPAGLVSRKQKGIIEDLEWKKSFISKAKLYNKIIVPVFIDARNSKFFYWISSVRKWLGIKTNIEMFYLVDEVYKQKGKTIKIIFGKPISSELFTDDFSSYQWAQKIKEHVYTLKMNPASII